MEMMEQAVAEAARELNQTPGKGGKTAVPVGEVETKEQEHRSSLETSQVLCAHCRARYWSLVESFLPVRRSTSSWQSIFSLAGVLLIPGRVYFPWQAFY
jgi:hypothetical protein